MSKILVLGAAGFVGSNIYYDLKKDHEVSGVDDFSFGYRDNNPEADIMSISDVYANDFDVIISSFCSNIIYSEHNPYGTYINNILNGIECFSNFNGKIIYLSTSSVYGNPDIIPTKEDARINATNSYSISKYVLEEYLMRRGGYTTLRLSNVYGERQQPSNPYCGVVNRFIHEKLTGKESKVYGLGKDTRDYTYVGDVLRAVRASLEVEACNTEINIGTGVETSIVDLLIAIEQSNVKYVDKRGIDGIDRRCLDVLKAERLLGWKPEVSLDEGIKLTTKWITENEKCS